MESGERRPQAPASGHHGNEAWNATVLAFIPSTSGLSVLLLQGNAHRGRGWGGAWRNIATTLPSPLPSPGPKSKTKTQINNPPPPTCLKEAPGSLGAIWGRLFGFLLRDLFTSCNSLAALTLNLMTFHVFVELLSHQFWFLFPYNFIIILRNRLPSLAPLPLSLTEGLFAAKFSQS